ncbi:hypothetical protein RF11_11512 [Thelohanellus kitauei]|uniref:MULE transposase domain-containing protein n=1 Tax=Thelohanellus kitauei TaxID=669202 RepID=A0A0C2MVK4_THEKT|nr:hypothetical protein RF11_11512 [Thelohanellus kitauei]
MVDFKIPTIASLKSIFPNAIINGCYYHLFQSFWMKIQEHNSIRSRYVDEPDFAFRLKMLVALTFVPTEYVSEAFEELLSTDFYREHFTIYSRRTNNSVEGCHNGFRAFIKQRHSNVFLNPLKDERFPSSEQGLNHPNTGANPCF